MKTTTEEKIDELLYLKNNSTFPIPLYGTCADLRVIHSEKVLVIVDGMLTTLGGAMYRNPESMAIIYVGENVTSSRCRRTIQIGDKTLILSYKNDRDWKADEGVIVEKYISVNPSIKIKGVDVCAVDYVGGYVVRFRKDIGLKSLKADDMITRTETAQQIKNFHGVKPVKPGDCENV